MDNFCDALKNLTSLENHSQPFKLPYSDIRLSDVQKSPTYDVEGLWLVSWLCVLEYVILWVRDKPLPPPHENLLSMSHGFLNHITKVCIRGFEFVAYIWVWENFSFLPQMFSDSVASFIFTVILIDFGYYWFHRFSHEVMMFWAIHQVHHSSYDITVSVGLRHSPLQNLFSWIFYLPLALIGLPPSHLVFHLHFNLLYQTWIHTAAIENLGPFELILNTPSHHRVHHGRNKFCIDTNYGGVFIIWDRLFGTFEKEKPDEEIYYGILLETSFWNIGAHQVFYLQAMIEKAKSMENWTNVFHTFWKGPSWQPGSSRTGRELDSSFINTRRERLKANALFPINCYVFLHLVAVLLILSNLTEILDASLFSLLACSVFVIAALWNVGIIYEGRPVAVQIELYRCLGGLILSLILPLQHLSIHLFIIPLFLISMGIWLLPRQTIQKKLGFQGKSESLKEE